VHRVPHSQPRAVVSTSLLTEVVIETATTSRSVITKTQFSGDGTASDLTRSGRPRAGDSARVYAGALVMIVRAWVKGSRTITYEGGADALTLGHAP
jgi:hypothetical protein